MEDTTITCSICDESFNSEQELRNHQQAAHARQVNKRRRARVNDPDADEQDTAA